MLWFLVLVLIALGVFYVGVALTSRLYRFIIHRRSRKHLGTFKFEE